MPKAKATVTPGVTAQQIIDAFNGTEAAKTSSQTLINEAIKTDAGKLAIGAAATKFAKGEKGVQDPRLCILRVQVQRADKVLTVAKDKKSGNYTVMTRRENKLRTFTKRIKPAKLNDGNLLALLAEVRNELRKRGLREPNTVRSKSLSVVKKAA